MLIWYNYKRIGELVWRKDGFLLCKMIYETIFEAIKGQDIVHTFLPFKLSNVCRLIAQEQGIAVTTAFHIVPQNVTAAMHLAWSRIINGVLLYSFKRYLERNNCLKTIKKN